MLVADGAQAVGFLGLQVAVDVVVVDPDARMTAYLVVERSLWPRGCGERAMNRSFPPVDSEFVVVADPSGWKLSENVV
jgi:hypothetical protein